HDGTEYSDTLPFLSRNLNDEAGVVEAPHAAMNCSADRTFCGAHKAASRGEFPSNAAPNNISAALLARQMAPEPSTSSAGHPAASNAKGTSGFINIFCLQLETSTSCL